MFQRHVFLVTTAALAALAFAPAAMAQVSSTLDAEIRAMMDQANAELAAQNADIRVGSAEYITRASSGKPGGKVFSNSLGIKKEVKGEYTLSAFVPFDIRRKWNGGIKGLTFAIDQVDSTPPLGGLTGAQTTEAIRNAMATWNEVGCSGIELKENKDFNTKVDVGLVAFLVRKGGSGFVFADIQHAGFADLEFNDAIIAVTFNVFFADPRRPGLASDIDNDGKDDIALREVYYNPRVRWGTDVDVESIALHEAGHALSHEHYGTAFVRKDGYVDFTPAAVMNAVYSGPRTKLNGTDVARHCHIWQSWGK